jgi:hypothetical protein
MKQVMEGQIPNKEVIWNPASSTENEAERAKQIIIWVN